MSEQEIQDKIDDFLLDNMSSEEKKEFELLREKDESVAAQYNLQKMIIDEMRYQKDFDRIVSKPKIVMFSQKRIRLAIMSVAAIFIGVLLVNTIFVNKQMENLYTLNYESPSFDEFRGEQDALLEEFKSAISLLETNQIKEARSALLKLYDRQQDYPYYEAVRWYLSLTELKLHNRSKAKKYLKELKESEFYGEKVRDMLDEL